MRENVTGAALWRLRTDVVAGAVFSVPGCVFLWQGQRLVAVWRDWSARPAMREHVTGAALWRLRTDVVAGAVFSAPGCVCVCVSVAGTAFGSRLEELDVVKRAARRPKT